MIINDVTINKFRGFKNQKFVIGSQLTVIAGQNGTQKTTLLGMVSQPFSITDQANPIKNEKPLSGGNYKSAFADKFKLSEEFDKPKMHQWTLHLNESVTGISEFTIESIPRNNTIRFWKKGTKEKGSGYIQLPVIYLSLSRLLPIGEDKSLSESDSVVLTEEEQQFYEAWHNNILIIPNLNIHNIDYLDSKLKKTIGANTDFYDWKMNSAGQDNIGKIILAVLSFKRLKDKYPEYYKGGILAIDEVDATLYPASQVRLIEFLKKFAAKLNLQVIVTTHSLEILNKACEWQFDEKIKDQVQVVFLKIRNNEIIIDNGVSYNRIKQNLNVVLDGKKKANSKILLFSEDNECRLFFKCLIKRESSKFNFIKVATGCNNLIQLVVDFKIPSFVFPESLVVLDGDVERNRKQMKKIRKVKNIILLPGMNPPELLLADLIKKVDENKLEKIYPDYTRQIAFKDINYNEIKNNREKAKEWFKSQEKYWGRESVKIINLWIQENPEEFQKFLENFREILSIYPNN